MTTAHSYSTILKCRVDIGVFCFLSVLCCWYTALLLPIYRLRAIRCFDFEKRLGVLYICPIHTRYDDDERRTADNDKQLHSLYNQPPLGKYVRLDTRVSYCCYTAQLRDVPARPGQSYIHPVLSVGPGPPVEGPAKGASGESPSKTRKLLRKTNQANPEKQ